MTGIFSPETHAASGKLAFETEDYLTAARHYEQAALAYEASGEKLLASEMKNNSSVAYLKGGNPSLALEVVSGTDQVFFQLGDRKLQAMSLGNQAAALEALHRSGEALDVYLHSSQILKEIEDQEYRPFVLQAIAGLQLRTGRPLEALASSRVALQTKKKLKPGERFLLKLLEFSHDLLLKR